MREIKFRAWDTENKIMYHNAQNTYDWDSIVLGYMEMIDLIVM